MSSVFDWAKRHCYVEFNYLEGMTLKKKQAAREERYAFEQEDLDKLFAPQKAYQHPYYRWLPLMALHTGARIEELCSLYIEDIYQKEGIWVIDINDNHDKKVKTLSSRRVVPVHSKLLELGFINFINSINHERVFPELKKSRDGYSQAASKWFGRYRKRVGVTGKKKVFHSFRHTVATHLQNKSVDRNLRDAILGHSDDSMSERYSKPGVKILKDVIEKLDFSLPQQKRWNVVIHI